MPQNQRRERERRSFGRQLSTRTSVNFCMKKKSIIHSQHVLFLYLDHVSLFSTKDTIHKGISIQSHEKRERGRTTLDPTRFRYFFTHPCDYEERLQAPQYCILFSPSPRDIPMRYEAKLLIAKHLCGLLSLRLV